MHIYIYVATIQHFSPNGKRIEGNETAHIYRFNASKSGIIIGTNEICLVVVRATIWQKYPTHTHTRARTLRPQVNIKTQRVCHTAIISI